MYIYIYIILNFHSRLRVLRGLVLSAAARAFTMEAPILDPVFSFFLTCSLGSHFLQKSRQISKTAVPGHHVQGWRKWFEKNTHDFGLLKTSQTKPPCRREHDFRVLALCRKNLILGLFWNFILERLWAPCAENKVSMDVWKLLLGISRGFLCSNLQGCDCAPPSRVPPETPSGFPQPHSWSEE